MSSQNSITIRFIPKGDKQLRLAIESLAKAQGKLEGRTKEVNKELKRLGMSMHLPVKFMRVTQKEANRLSKSFATLRSRFLLFSFAMSLGGRQIIQFSENASRVEQMELAFSNLTNSNESAAISMDKLRIATDGTMSSIDLLQQANSAMILGVTKNTDEMAQMFDMAQRLGKALGRDAASSVESLITGIGRQSRLMLDNIGIIVRSDEAYQDYAIKLGKTADRLTDAEKKQAFFNATIESARKKLLSVGDEQDSASDSLQRFSATSENLGIKIGEALLPAMARLADSLTIVFEKGMDFLEFFDLVDTSLDKSINKLTKEQVITLSLSKELKNVAVNSEEYFKVKEKIIARFPNYFSNLESEKITQNDLNDSLNQHNIFIARQIQLNIMKNALSEKEEQLGKILAALSERKIEQARLEAQAIQNLTDKLRKDGEAMNLSGKELDAYVDKQLKLNIELGNTSISFDETADNGVHFTRIISGLTGSLPNLISTLFQLNKSNTETSESFGANKASMDEINETVNTLTNDIALSKQVIEEFLQVMFEKFGISFDQAGNSTNDFGEKLKKMSPEMIEAKGAIDQLTSAITNYALSSQSGARTFKGLGDVVVAQIERIAATFLANKATFEIMNLIFPSIGNLIKAPTLLSTVAGFLGFHNGGMVQSYHSGGTAGNVPAILQEGEFVMQRSAVESIGQENLNRMNRTGTGAVNVTFTGNVMSQDFIESEDVTAIKKAVRRGADLGIS